MAASYAFARRRSSCAPRNLISAPRLACDSQILRMVGNSNSPNATFRRSQNESALATEFTPAEALATSTTSSGSAPMSFVNRARACSYFSILDPTANLVRGNSADIHQMRLPHVSKALPGNSYSGRLCARRQEPGNESRPSSCYRLSRGLFRCSLPSVIARFAPAMHPGKICAIIVAVQNNTAVAHVIGEQRVHSIATACGSPALG